MDERMIGVRFPAGLKIFFFDIMSRSALVPTQPPIQWVPGTLSLGVAHDSSPSSGEVKECVEV